MKILCAYNANIDALYSISGTEVSAMFASMNTAEIIQKLKNPPGIINSNSDFLSGLILCMKEGIGAEWLINEPKVFKYLKDHFSHRSKLRIGGNMGIMANVLSEMGADLVVPNVVKPTEKLLSFFSKKAILIPGHDSKSQENSDEEENIHFVFDFKKGEKVELEDFGFTVPRENRFIATYDLLNMSLSLSPHFENYVIQHAGEMDGLLISGFHMMLEKYPDGSTYLSKLKQAIKQIQKWGSMNEEMSIHVEFGHFTKKYIALEVFSMIAPLVDSIGMNEDELTMLMPLHEISTSKILQMDIFSIIEASMRSLLTSGLKKMIVHTREYILSISKQPDLKPEEQLKAMGFGVACAGIFASTGKLYERNKLELISSTLKESEFGKAQMQRFIETAATISFERGVAGIYNGYQICIMPTLLSDNPVSTVGLGDTVTASIFLRELEIRKR